MKPVKVGPEKLVNISVEGVSYSIPLNTTNTEAEKSKPGEGTTIVQIIASNLDVIMSLAILVLALALALASSLGRYSS